MIQSPNFLLASLPYECESSPHRPETLCSANWRLGAFGPTSSIYPLAKAIAAPIPSFTAARAVPAMSNTRSAMKGFGPHGRRSRNGSETAKPRIWSRNLNVQCIPSSSATMNAASWKATAAATDGTTSAIGAAGGAATPQPVAVRPRRHPRPLPMQQVVPVQAEIAAAVAIAPLAATARPAASQPEGRA